MSMKFSAAAPNQYYGMAQQAIINGNFDRWERGTSFTNPVNATYTADRWQTTISNSGTLPTTIIHSQLSLTPGDIQGASFGYRVNTNGAGSGFGASDVYYIQQKIENGTRNLCGVGKKVTVSFWAKSDIANKRVGIRLTQNYGTGGSPTAGEVITGQNFTLTTSWTKYIVIFTMNTLVGKTFGTNKDDFINVFFYHMWGSTIATQIGASTAETFVGTGNIDVAQVLVNSGDYALPFSPKSPGEETSACQRFAISYTDANISFPIGNGFALSTTLARIHVELPQTMRIAPILTATATDWQISDGVTATDLTAIAIETNQNNNKTVTLLCTVASGLTQFRPYQLIADGTANRLMLFTAEL